MAFDAHKNFASSNVLVPPSPADSGTSLTVNVGGGALFPAVPFNATVCPANTLPTPSNAEIVRVTNIVGDVLTITRAQESSTAQNIAVGYYIANSITAKDITDIEAQALGGTVTAISIASANGFAGTSSGGATPVLTITTSITGILKGNGTAISAASAGADYVAPSAYASANGLTMATARLLGRTTAGGGAAEEISVGTGLSLSAGSLSCTVTAPVGANPTASVGLSAVNGSAATFMRSDGAPALSQSIAPTWAGVHIFNAGNLTLQDTTTTSKQLIFASNSSTALTANHTLTIDVVNADRTIKFTGNAVLNQDVSTVGTPVFAGLFSTGMDSFNPFGTMPTAALATTTSASAIYLAKFSNDGTGPLLAQFKSRGTTVGSGVVVSAGDPVGGFNGYGYDGAAYSRAGAVFILAQGTISSGIVPGTVQLRASNSSGTLTTMVDANGNTGVVTLGGALQLSNTYVATPPTCSGYVTLKDSTGTTYKVLVST